MHWKCCWFLIISWRRAHRWLVGWLSQKQNKAVQLFSSWSRSSDGITSLFVISSLLCSKLLTLKSMTASKHVFNDQSYESPREDDCHNMVTWLFVTTRESCVQPKVQLVWGYVSEAPGRQRRQSRSLWRGKARCTFGIVQLGSVGLRLPRQRRQCVRHRASCVLFHGHHLVLEEQQRRMRSTWEPPAGQDATDRHRG